MFNKVLQALHFVLKNEPVTFLSSYSKSCPLSAIFGDKKLLAVIAIQVYCYYIY